MTTSTNIVNVLAVVAADLNKGMNTLAKAENAYRAMLVAAHDTLMANGVTSTEPLKSAGDTRSAWLQGIAAAYLSKREFATWAGEGAMRSKDLECEGNTQGLTEKGKLNNRVSKRSTDIVKALDGVFKAEGETGEEKAANAKKGANANEPRALDIRIAEEISKLIKAVDKDATKEKPTLRKHGEIKRLLDKAATDIKALLK